MKLKQILNEAMPNRKPGRPVKNKYETYHPSLTSAVYEAEKYATLRGYETDPEDWAETVGSGPRKPSKGKTNRYSIKLFKNGKEQRKMLQIQVYNRGTDTNTYELNAYIS